MSSRYDDRDWDRGERSGRGRDSEYGRSSERTQERYRWGREEDDDRENRYAGERGGVVNTAAHAPVANTDAVANPAATVAVRNHTAAENRIVVGNSAAAKLTAADLVATRAAVTWAAAR